MQDNSKYAVGIDVGTTTVRCAIGLVDSETGVPSVIGVGEASNSGMRKGLISKLSGPVKAIDDALRDAEQMSGYQVDMATVSINGSHIISTRVDGTVSVNSPGNEVTEDVIARVEEMAVTTGKRIPANRDIINIIPFDYKLDGQDGIQDPLGMVGTRLDISANVISSLRPNMDNLHKAAEEAQVKVNATVPSVVAAAKAVITEKQIEGGVAVIDFGGSTTGIAIYEEGDLQYMSVLPVGGDNITNDLAIYFKIAPEIAEIIKLKHASALGYTSNKEVSVKYNNTVMKFNTEDIDEAVGARLEEIFEDINKEIDKAGRRGKLPNGVVITGGASQLRDLPEYAKKTLHLATRMGRTIGVSGDLEQINKPEYITAMGLMLSDIDNANSASFRRSDTAHVALEKSGSFIKKFIGRFRV